MVTVPDDTPVTLPLTGSTTATLVLSLLHTPPLVALLNVTEAPAHTDELPVMPVSVVGNDTASSCVTLPGQPNKLVTVYVIVVIPTDTPVTMPLLTPTVPTA